MFWCTTVVEELVVQRSAHTAQNTATDTTLSSMTGSRVNVKVCSGVKLPVFLFQH